MDDEAREQALVTALTTEHFTLQTARGATISESNGRASIYLGALSSGLIALGFVASDSDLFPIFTAAVLPGLLVLGTFTFVRLVQTSTENMLYLNRIQRIRRWYGELAPDGSPPWFTDAAPEPSQPDDEAGDALRSTGMRPSTWQMLFTTAAMVGAINSIVVGVGVAAALRLGDALPISVAAVVGIAAAVVAFAGHVRWEQAEFRRVVR